MKTKIYYHLLIILFVALLISLFAPKSHANSFGGGGAGGSWDEPNEECSLISLNNVPISAGPYLSRELACHSAQISVKNYYNNNTALNYDISIEDTRCKIGDAASIGLNCTVKTTCEDGYEKDANGRCQPKKCPTGQTLVNGQCKPKTCPAGQALDASGNCKPRDDVCPSGQEMVNGQCRPKNDPDDPDDPNDPDDPDLDKEWPPFCEWASKMCAWYEDWKSWSNDYNANEESARQDRADIKDSLNTANTSLNDIRQDTNDIKNATEQTKLTLDQIREQDSTFYNEIRDFLRNYKHSDNDNTPNEQYPLVEFPPYCEWALTMCNWYLDWKDSRSDYNTNEQKANEDREEIIKNQDDQLEQDKDFYQDIRDFIDWFKDKEEETEEPDPNDNQNPVVEDRDFQPDTSDRLGWQAQCPFQRNDHVIDIGGSTTTITTDYSEMCQIASQMRPFVLLAGAFISMMIVAGGIKR